MNNISPSQFLEALLEFQRKNLINDIIIQARKFNELVDFLSDLNLCARFGFLDLIEFVEKFEDSLSYKEFALHISYTEEFLNEIKRYNNIYISLENMDKINEVWENHIQ